MTDSLQYLLVIAILLCAVGFLARRGWQSFRGARGGCVRGCSTCPLIMKRIVKLEMPQRDRD